MALEAREKETCMKTCLLVLLPLLFILPGSAHAAIAYDNSIAVDPGTNLSTSYSTSFTNTAGNALVVAVWTRYASAYTKPTSVTYNGVALTYLADYNDGAADYKDVSFWGLASPATGANTLTVNLTGTSIRNAVMAVSLTGAAASPFGAVGGGGASSASSGSFSVTTTAANSWIVGAESDDGGTAATVTGTNQTLRASVVAAGGYSNTISTQTTTSTGSYTNSWNFSATGAWAGGGVEVKEATAAVGGGLVPLWRAFWF